MLKCLRIAVLVVACLCNNGAWAETYPLAKLVEEAHDLREDGKFRKAIKLYLEAAEAGNPEAMNAIGVMAVNGMGMSKNEARGFSYVKDAAEMGYPKAQKNLAEFYEKGIRVKKNQTKADYWYAKYESQKKDEQEIHDRDSGDALVTNQQSPKELFEVVEQVGSEQTSLMLNDNSGTSDARNNNCGTEIIKNVLLKQFGSKFGFTFRISNSPLDYYCEQDSTPSDKAGSQPAIATSQSTEGTWQENTEKPSYKSQEAEPLQPSRQPTSAREHADCTLIGKWEDLGIDSNDPGRVRYGQKVLLNDTRTEAIKAAVAVRLGWRPGAVATSCELNTLWLTMKIKDAVGNTLHLDFNKNVTGFQPYDSWVETFCLDTVTKEVYRPTKTDNCVLELYER